MRLYSDKPDPSATKFVEMHDARGRKFVEMLDARGRTLRARRRAHTQRNGVEGRGGVDMLSRGFASQ